MNSESTFLALANLYAKLTGTADPSESPTLQRYLHGEDMTLV